MCYWISLLFRFVCFRENLEDKLYVAKKVIITEIGSAFHEIMVEFEKSRDMAEKKRIGSDMTNIAMGHMIRGRFCSSLAALALDGLRPYRLEGLVSDDIWKVTTAFCNEGTCSNVLHEIHWSLHKANHGLCVMILQFFSEIVSDYVNLYCYLSPPLPPPPHTHTRTHTSHQLVPAPIRLWYSQHSIVKSSSQSTPSRL